VLDRSTQHRNPRYHTLFIRTLIKLQLSQTYCYYQSLSPRFIFFLFFSHRSKNLEEYIATLENNVKLKNDDISHLESEITALKSEKAQIASEMSAVNQVKIITFMEDNNN
jgi:septal ring factor EnvC (AmiA/AmiB activator)